MEKYKELLNGLAETLQLESIEINSNNEACLLFDENLLVFFRFDELRNEILLKSRMGYVDAERQIAVYEKLLEANLFWNETAGSTFSLENDSVTLSIRLLISTLDKARFESEVETFINVTEYWLEKMKTLQSDSENSVGTSNTAAIPAFIRA